VKRDLYRLRHDAWRRLRGGEVTPWRAGLSVGLGLAIGLTPLWGLHTLLVLALCVPLRLDVPVAWVASNVSLPFVSPFIAFAEIEIGAFLRTGHTLPVEVGTLRSDGVGAFLAELAIGAAVLSVTAGALGGVLSYVVTTFRMSRAASRG
jgi:uncharacterized protein (DUF2062 family)